MDARSLRQQLLLSTTMLVGALVGYGRRAYGACAVTVSPNYLCSGANAVQQNIVTNNADVTTAAGFSVNTANAIAVNITAAGDLTYTDDNGSTLIAAGTALYIRSSGDYSGTPGAATVDTDGNLTGGNFGIDAINLGTGQMSVAADGDVTGTTQFGILRGTMAPTSA